MNNKKVIKRLGVGMTSKGEVRYDYRGVDGMNYTTPEPMLSKNNKLYCPWIRIYNPKTRQSVILNYKDPRYYRVSTFFFKYIPLFKEQYKDQDISEHEVYIIEA